MLQLFGLLLQLFALVPGWRGAGWDAGGSDGGSVTARGLTMKEYDEHLARLNKENFALKLRVYFLEEQQGQQGQAAPQLYKTNIELKVRVVLLRCECLVMLPDRLG